MSKTKSKIKAVTPEVSTREEFSEICAEIGALQTKLNARKLELTQRIDEVNAEFTDIETIQEELKAKMKPALEWCLANEKTEFSQSKTLEFVRASAQFRVGNPEVKLRGKWKEADVLKDLQSFVKLMPSGPNNEPAWTLHGVKFIRQVEELNKQEIIASRTLLTPEEWFAIGIKIVQEKSLIVTPKGEKLDDKQTLKEAA